MGFLARHLAGLSRSRLWQAFRLVILGLAFSLLVYGVTLLRAQEPETIPDMNVLAPQPRVYNPLQMIVTDLQSTAVGQTYRLFIALPRTYNTTERVYPVIYVLDGNALFSLVRDTAELMQIPEQVPEVIIVGIGYPEATYMDTLSLRGYDQTFRELTSVEIANYGYPFGETGGGLRFLDFIQTEIIPFIEESYRADESDRALLGWSSGGDTVLYSMFHQPGVFHRLAAISPAFVGSSMGIPALEQTYSQQNTNLEANLFLGDEAATQIVKNFVETLQMREYNRFELTPLYYKNESHFSVVPHAITDALEALYP